MKKTLIVVGCLFSCTSSFCMENVSSDEQDFVPPEYIETITNVHATAQQLAAIKLSRTIMAKLVSTSSILIGLGGLILTRHHTNPRLWLSLNSALTLAATIAAGALSGPLFSWLWHRRSYATAIANTNGNVCKLHALEAPFLCALFVHMKHTKKDKTTLLTTVVNEIQKRISIPPYYSSNVKSEVSDILTKSFSMATKNEGSGAKEFAELRTAFQGKLRNWFLQPPQ